MFKHFALLALVAATAHARSSGAPTCGETQPQHPGNPKESTDLRDNLRPTFIEPSTTPGKANEFSITFMTHAPYKGLLIKPQEGIEGEFMDFDSFDQNKFQIKESGACVTHRNPSPVAVPKVFGFRWLNAVPGEKPTFDVIVVEERNTWWTNVVVAQ